MTHLIVIILLITFFSWGLGIVFSYEHGWPRHKQMLGSVVGKWIFEIDNIIELWQLEIKVAEDDFEKFQLSGDWTNEWQKIKEKKHQELIELRKENNAKIRKQQNIAIALKPILFCSKCFPSFWGTLIYFGYWLVWMEVSFELYLFYGWLISIVSATGLVHLLHKIR